MLVMVGQKELMPGYAGSGYASVSHNWCSCTNDGLAAVYVANIKYENLLVYS